MKLSLSQRNVKKFSHPFFRELPVAHTDYEALIFKRLPLLRNIIGRYLYHWPLTRRFLDEMVSAGLLAIVARPNEPEDHYFHLICNRIEDEISRLQGIVAIPICTNTRRQRAGKPPITGEAALLVDFAVADPSLACVDVLEIVDLMRQHIEQLRRQFNAKLAILSPENWQIPLGTLSQQTGVPEHTLREQRNHLWKHYLKLAGDKDETS